jgi:hypothetical protein
VISEVFRCWSERLAGEVGFSRAISASAAAALGKGGSLRLVCASLMAASEGVRNRLASRFASRTGHALRGKGKPWCGIPRLKGLALPRRCVGMAAKKTTRKPQPKPQNGESAMVDAPNEPSGAMETQSTDQKAVLDSLAIPMNEIGLRKSQSFSYHQVITEHRRIQPLGDSSTPILPDDLVEEKATLEFILRLLNEADYIPSINEKKDKNWKLLPQILAEIPFGLRRQALVKYIDGTRYFGKVPVKRINPEKSGGPASIEVVGPARPVLCPERAPEGCEFILAWREGNFWNWDLEEFQMVRDDLQPDDLIQQISREYSKYLNLMGRYENSDSSSQAHFSRLILRLLDSRPIGQVIKLDGSVQLSNSLSTRNEDSVVVAFYCGVLFASKVMYEGAVANYH